MGEYAIRKSDRTEIKIGTCEEMYYLRFEDRDKVIVKPGNVDPIKEAGQLRFRVPFVDEDEILPGDYEHYNRGLWLYQSVNSGTAGVWHSDFTDESKLEDVGTIQLRHEDSGLLLNVPCYHGMKLPEVSAPMKAFWNGKGHSFELSSLRGVEEEDGLHVYPVVRCRHCHNQWRYQWSDVLEYVGDFVLRNRLFAYANAVLTASDRA